MPADLFISNRLIRGIWYKKVFKSRRASAFQPAWISIVVKCAHIRNTFAYTFHDFTAAAVSESRLVPSCQSFSLPQPAYLLFHAHWDWIFTLFQNSATPSVTPPPELRDVPRNFFINFFFSAPACAFCRCFAMLVHFEEISEKTGVWKGRCSEKDKSIGAKI